LVSPVEQEFVVKGKTINQELPAYSFTVIRIKQVK